MKRFGGIKRKVKSEKNLDPTKYDTKASEEKKKKKKNKNLSL